MASRRVTCTRGSATSARTVPACPSRAAWWSGDHFSASVVELNLGLCTQLVAPTIECRELLSLDLGMCSSLEAPRLHLAAVRALDLSMLGFTKLTLRAPRLRALNLCGCRSLREVELDECDSLQSVRMHGATLLDPSIFPRARGASSGARRR